ncbi:MAG: MBL fold metallo-hydrolase [Parasphingopyxis sp.]|uniref:MBL fold metallo-hydrolase n=1 Tax=Parasphingopyxis sp. TaxID=1920299 RepID=UPI003FA0F958
MAALALAAGLAVGGAWLFQAQIGAWMFGRGVAAAVERDEIAALPDGLHVAMCGTGSPLPDPSRAGPCTAVIAGDRLFIVDIGAGAVRNFGPMGLPVGDVAGVFLTHFHSDHIDGLGELLLLRWTGGGHDRPLPVIGPEGVEDVLAGLATAYAADSRHRVDHHGETVVPPSGRGGRPFAFAVPPPGAMRTVYDEGGLRVQAFRVDHGPVRPAVGYRFDYAGRSVVISGDTAREETVAAACDGCDLMIHEALNAEMVQRMRGSVADSGNARLARILEDILDYHATPFEAEEIAARGEAGMLVLTHIVPAVPDRFMEAAFLSGTGDRYAGDIVLARDGMLFSLPADDEAIGRSMLM